MMAIQWAKELSVGNEIIDSEHRNLIGMVNSIEYAIGTKDSFALLGAIKLFKDEVDDHFANEARFARAFNYHFEQHGLEHRHFQEELQQKIDDLTVKIGVWPEYAMGHYPQLLRNWLIGHIACEDMKMKPVLQGYPCDFRPV